LWLVADDPLRPEAIRRCLRTRVFGRRLYFLPEVDSTNRIAKWLIAQGERDGTVVVADHQTAGRGRRERVWESAPWRNLLFSIILTPERAAIEVLPVTLVFSLAVADVLAARCSEHIGVKWPNDVVASDGKLCGILSEGTSRSGIATDVVVGVGINVNMRREEFARAGVPGAASCFTLTASKQDRAVIFADVLEAMEDRYEVFLADGFGAFVDEYTGRLAMVDKVVTYVRDGQPGRGRVVGVRDDGGLIVTRAGRESILYDEEITQG
jgi:BirA family biotin operon repressor/biotin-[acetyl-CoA-carboxylase] ligase